MIRQLTLVLLGLMSWPVAIRAADDQTDPPKPQSPPAMAAIDKADHTVGEAERVYRRAVVSAKKQLISDLKTAQSASMKSKNLDEANAIAAAIKQAEADITAIDGVRFTIQAAADWQHTITVKRGETVHVAARGKWTYNRYKNMTAGPDGAPKEDGGKGTWAHLEGRIGDGPAFKIGASASFVADADGVLEMEMNDPFHNDNEGSIEVVVAHW